MQRNTAAYVLGAMVLGVLVGVIIQLTAETDGFVQIYFVEGICRAGGIMFVNMLKLLIVPLIFFSIVHAVCSLNDVNQFGRLGLKTFFFYLLNTAIAIAAALCITSIVQPGKGSDFNLPSAANSDTTAQLPSLFNIIIDVIPSNPFEALAAGNILQILFMAIITGIAIQKLDNTATRKISQTFSLANSVMMKLINMVMSFAPLGVLLLSIKLAATLSVNSVGAVMSYICTVLGILSFWLFVFYPMVISLITNISPISFLKKVREQLLFALSTSSSNATIPITYKTLTDKIGVSSQIAGFAVPLGATMNMSGAAVYMTVATIFIANISGVDLSLSQTVTLALITFFLAIATGGIPGGAIVTTSILLQQLGLPIEGMAIIFATDRMLDAMCTATNVVGDTTVATIVAKTENAIHPIETTIDKKNIKADTNYDQKNISFHHKTSSESAN